MTSLRQSLLQLLDSLQEWSDAARLKEAMRSAGVSEKDIPKSEVSTYKSNLKYRRRERMGVTGYKFGQKIRHAGKEWLIFDWDADSTAKEGYTFVLVTPDYKKLRQGVTLDSLQE